MYFKWKNVLRKENIKGCEGGQQWKKWLWMGRYNPKQCGNGGEG